MPILPKFQWRDGKQKLLWICWVRTLVHQNPWNNCKVIPPSPSFMMNSEFPSIHLRIESKYVYDTCLQTLYNYTTNLKESPLILARNILLAVQHGRCNMDDNMDPCNWGSPASLALPQRSNPVSGSASLIHWRIWISIDSHDACSCIIQNHT